MLPAMVIRRCALAMLLGLSLLLAGCEDVDVLLAADAGADAVKAITLSGEAVRESASQAADFSDRKHRIAPSESGYARRLARITSGHLEQDGYLFDCRVYLDPEVNAFAMADGTIRIYSGLMDMMSDGELLFVLGHEMGHVTKDHVRKKMRVAYAGRAVRKGVASLNHEAGALAGSALGGFAERLLNAQFSQQEEREADDYGLVFLRKTGAEPRAAVTALQKLAGLGSSHSFLSSHPAPDKRAERLSRQL
ncbi:M48 family metalloprotease [Thiovibrio sp. JS02]